MCQHTRRGRVKSKNIRGNIKIASIEDKMREAKFK